MDFLNSANVTKRKILLAFFLISASFFISVNLSFAGPKCDGAPDGGGECKLTQDCSFSQAYNFVYNDCSAGSTCCKKTAGAAPEISRCVQYGNGTCITGDKCPGGTIPSSGYTCIGAAEFCCVPEVRVPQTQAQVQNGGVTPTPTSSPAAIPSSNSGAVSGLVPCRNNCTLCHLILGFKKIFDFLLGLLFTATILIITVAGVFYMVSSGSKGMMDKAKKALTYALIAFFVGMGSWLLVNIVMQMVGFQHPTGGNWWQFTCDTTQTQGPAVTSPGSTLASQSATNQSGQTNKAQGDGSCGGIAVAQNSDQCKLTSQALDDKLKCINQKMSGSALNNFQDFNVASLFTNKALAGSVSVSSLGLNKNSDWQTKCVGANYAGTAYCSHAQYSCHFGGTNCQGQVNGADLTGNMGAISQAAIDCGADTVIYNNMAYFGGNSKAASDHTDHVHISVNNAACGCDYLK